MIVINLFDNLSVLDSKDYYLKIICQFLLNLALDLCVILLQWPFMYHNDIIAKQSISDATLL